MKNQIRAFLRSSLIKVYTVGHSIFMIKVHYYNEKNQIVFHLKDCNGKVLRALIFSFFLWYTEHPSSEQLFDRGHYTMIETKNLFFNQLRNVNIFLSGLIFAVVKTLDIGTNRIRSGPTPFAITSAFLCITVLLNQTVPFWDHLGHEFRCHNLSGIRSITLECN